MVDAGIGLPSYATQVMERITQWEQGIAPLIGIGELSSERANGVIKAGADVVSLVTDITLNSDPEAQVERWLSLTADYR